MATLLPSIRTAGALLLAVILVGFYGALTAWAESPFGVFSELAPRGTDSFIPGEVLVRYRHDNRFRIERITSGLSVPQAVAALRHNPNVLYAEPNFTAMTFSVPNDPYFRPYQWNFDNAANGGVHAEAAWEMSTGENTVIAVLDTGIAYEDYSEGRGRQKTTYRQAADLAGTCFVAGYDFINSDAHANDDNSHGTHVAGTIAQTTNNNQGTAGLANGACLMPVKVLNADGFGSYGTIANGIYYAADHGADVINLSLGGTANSETLRDAVAYAYQKGVTIVAASGNDNGPVSYPAAYDEYVIAVGATRYDQARASYSNFGPALDVVAPGGDTSVDQNADGFNDGILQQTFNPNTGNPSDFGYWFLQGTSMATPHVSAAAAMVLAHGQAATPAEVRMALQSTARDLGAAGKDDLYGYGLLDIAAALAWTAEPAEPVDAAPTVILTAPTMGAVITGTSTLTALAADDEGVTVVRFLIDGSLLSSDATAPYEAAWNTAAVADGTHTVSVEAVDTLGQTAVADAEIEVDNVDENPVASAGADQSGVVGETLSFSGADSSDDRGVAAYRWNFGDGQEAVGETATHAYATAGTYAVTLTVTDTSGQTATDQLSVVIAEAPAAATSAMVSEIAYLLVGGRTNDRHLAILPRIENNLGAAVGNASISLQLQNDQGGSWNFTGVTGSDGSVQFDLKNAPSGCYSSTITSLTAAGLSWDGLSPANGPICKMK